MPDQRRKRSRAPPSMSSLKKLDIPKARELAETMLFLEDARHSFQALNLWFSRYTGDKRRSDDDQIISDSLVRDAIIQIIGCFDKSAEHHLDPNEVFSAIEGGVEYFNWLKGIRDAYAAHKFGSLRQCIVGVFLDPESKPMGVGEIGMRQDPFGIGDKTDLLRFIGVVGKFLQKKVQDLHEQILQDAKKMPVDSIALLVDATAYAVEPKESELTRSALQRSRAGQPFATRPSKRKKGTHQSER